MPPETTNIVIPGDPVSASILAGAALVQAITQLVIVLADGQTPEQRKQFWDWYIKDVAFWRKLLGIDK